VPRAGRDAGRWALAGETFHDWDVMEQEAENYIEEIAQEWMDEMVGDRAVEVGMDDLVAGAESAPEVTGGDEIAVY